MEDEWEEEEQLVVMELSGIIHNDFLSKCQSTCKILDIDSERPMMQVGPYLFAGEYEDAFGTYVAFEEVPRKGKANSCPELKYLCHTMKKLSMQRIFLSEKKDGETVTAGGNSEEKCTSNQSNQEENVNTQEAIEDSMENKDMDSAVG